MSEFWVAVQDGDINLELLMILKTRRPDGIKEVSTDRREEGREDEGEGKRQGLSLEEL